ncbi:TonB-dependent receptor domain-containing protein [Erwinia sp. S38]|uniref:TonB-dependent receptor domain-containing protein n=1 Tax=Erwinia sp. S38 TaxID=2769338 RepID=UPI001909E238|nr:TonB-dependent receptor [Erwinia sp. S38]MBK0004819.1 TonB-dependent receptor [Erwinia sp. S38]
MLTTGLTQAQQVPETTEIESIVVEADSIQPFQPLTRLAGDELAHRRQGSLGETLAGLPGIHLDNFGAGASKPVIRGQTLPRIEILSDGSSMFDASALSPDHAITAEPLLLDEIEILRGPAAVLFGGNAVNGAVNLIDSKIPKSVPVENFTGASEIRYGSGDNERTAVGKVTAGVGSIAVHAEGFQRRAGDYAVPSSYGLDRLVDSFANSSSYSLGASWITSFGYIGVSHSIQNSEYGLPGHSHANGACHTHGLDLHCESHGGWRDPFSGYDDSHTALIRMRNERTDLRSDYYDFVPGISHARIRMSYTDYSHDELDGGVKFSRYTNNAYDGRLDLTHNPLLGFTGTFGVQYSSSTLSGLNVNDVHKGFKPVEYNTENVGIFFSEAKSFGAFDFEFSARKDWRKTQVPNSNFDIVEEMMRVTGYSRDLVLESFSQKNFDEMKEEYFGFFKNRNPSSKQNPFSISAGLNFHLDDHHSISFSLARTERAPSVREYFAYGNNLATNSYEVGLAKTWNASDRLPKPSTEVTEKTKSINVTFRRQRDDIEFEIGLFHQYIDNYVFSRLIETETEGGTPHNYLVYTAADAMFTGVDGQISYRFSPESRVVLFGDTVRTKIKSEDDKLPRIPPGRLGSRYEWSRGSLSAQAEYYHTFAQRRFASYETKTDSYNMINATLAYRFELTPGQNTEVSIRANNVLNELGYVHTSFVKNQSPLRGRNFLLGLRHDF